MQSPDFIVPKERIYEKKSALQNLFECLCNFNHAVDEIEPEGLITGLPFGDATKLELVHFIFYHTQQHLMQMRRITGAL